MSPASSGDLAKGREGRIVHRLAGQGRAGARVEIDQPRLDLVLVEDLPVMAEGLAVDHVIAVAAPGVEHLRVGAGPGIEQGRCGREALRALLDRLPAGRGEIGHARKSAIISPAVALAEPTTPGMPAPGWVPAPTK